MKTIKMISKIATKISTVNLLKIDNILRVLKLHKLRSIISGELMSRNDLLINF